MLSRILFQASWRPVCVLCHRKNVPSDRTANQARRGSNVRPAAVTAGFQQAAASSCTESHVFLSCRVVHLPQ